MEVVNPSFCFYTKNDVLVSYIVPIFADVSSFHHFFTYMGKNDVMWRHVTSRGQIDKIYSKSVSLNDILLWSKYEVKCII